MIKVLVVDDENSICEFFEIFFRREGYEVTVTTDSIKALAMIENQGFDIVISDIKMPGIGGMQLLERTKHITPETIVILITAYGSLETAIEALQKGAYDYILKPFQVDNIKHTIFKASERIRLAQENTYLKNTIDAKIATEPIIGKGEKIRTIINLIEKVKDKNTNVLITGESGTGKELIAKAIHYSSISRNSPFITINCAAIPETLIESELFGHIKGAFTGASSHKKGLFEYAHGGTIFLDEIGELTLSTQVKLLRVLQERVVRRIGSLTDTKIDVRIIAATNRDLEKEVQEGRFREDLFYRLNVFHILMPPLRERKEDIPEMVEYFIRQLAPTINKSVTGIESRGLDLLLQYDFKGNTRELKNILERGLTLETTTLLTAATLEPWFKSLKKSALPSQTVAISDEGIEIEAILDSIEKEYLIAALTRSKGNRQEAARLLKMSFRSIRYRLSKHNLDRFLK